MRLNSEVIRVEYVPDDQQLLVHIRHHGDENSTQRTSVIRCEHLIWTSSLGYLKEHFTSIFADESELIEQKRTAIENLGFDTVNKVHSSFSYSLEIFVIVVLQVVMVYEKPLWPKSVSEIFLVHPDKESIIDLASSLKKIFVDEKIDMEIIRQIVAAIHRYDVLPSTETPVLITWFGGPAAMLIEDFPVQIIGQICHRVLCHSLNISAESNQPIRTLK